MQNLCVLCFQFYATSIGSKTKNRLDSIGDYGGWDVSTINQMIPIKSAVHVHTWIALDEPTYFVSFSAKFW